MTHDDVVVDTRLISIPI